MNFDYYGELSELEKKMFECVVLGQTQRKIELSNVRRILDLLEFDHSLYNYINFEKGIDFSDKL